MSEVEYQDDRLTIDAGGITIGAYSFPLLSSRRLSWGSIRSAKRLELGAWTGRFRIWGMGLKPYWFNFDLNRPNKTVGFALDSGRAIKAVITPEDPERVESILSRRKLFRT